MSIDQEKLAAEILEGFTALDDVDVPDGFVDFVADRIVGRPTPTRHDDPLAEIVNKLDEILDLLRGGPPK